MIYMFWVAENYEYLNLYDFKKDHENFYRLSNGEKLGDNWDPPLMIVERKGSRKKNRLESDLFDYSGFLVLTEKAKDCLKSILELDGEILPLRTMDNTPLYLYNPPMLKKALDLDNSEVRRYDNGDIAQIYKHVFFVNIIKDVEIFTIPFESATFCSDKFKNLVEQYHLVGQTFKKVWPL